MKRARAALGVVVAVLLTGGIGALSQVPYPVEAAGQAWIRLSWRVSAPGIEECRALTDAELSDLPIHMRRDTVCETQPTVYRLHIALDDRAVEETLIRGGGTRRDQPIHVYRELRTRAGAHRVAIRLTPEPIGNAAGGIEARTGAPSLELTEELELADGEVALVTRGPDGGLEVRRREP